MKNIFKIITLLSLSLITLYAENINECKTDIYYGNGIWNTRNQAKESIFFLQTYIIDKEIINDDPKLKAKYGEVKLQYNWGQGNMQDVLETYYQLKEAGQVQEYQFFAVIAILTKGDPVLTLGTISYEKLMEPFTRGWEAGNVDEMWEKYYHESFKLSHKVLLISHSQGGLFANRVYDKINPTKYKNYFANLQVASPADKVKASKGDYVTLSTDVGMVDPVVNFIPGSMNPNASGLSGHTFVGAYLAQPDSLSKIITKTKQLLSDLDTESSQWELDQEINKNTKDYRITLKHRFDSSITTMDGVEVYPFTPAKNLYYVQGEFSEDISGYVKASCGGTKILDADKDTWDNQQDNEVYYLEGTGERIISEEFDFLVTVTDNAVYYYPIDYKDGDSWIEAYFQNPYNSYYCDTNYYKDAFKKFKDVSMIKASEYFKDVNWHGDNFLLPADLFLHRVEYKLRDGGVNSNRLSSFKELSDFIVLTRSLEYSSYQNKKCYPQGLYIH